MAENVLAKMQSPNQLAQFLGANETKIRDMLPQTSVMSVSSLINAVKLAAIRQPKILQCSPASILSAVYDAASLGLDPSGGVRGAAYLVPYKDTLQLIPGYRGLIELVRRTANYTIDAKLVFQKELDLGLFEIDYGTKREIRHRPYLKDDRGNPALAYFVAEHPDGTRHIDHMLYSEIMSIRERSSGWKAYKSGYVKSCTWETDENQMALKTMIRRGIKLLPISAELFVKALDLVDQELGVVESEAERSDTPPLPPARGRMGNKAAKKAETEIVTDAIKDDPQQPADSGEQSPDEAF